jgi:hypothetical protein
MNKLHFTISNWNQKLVSSSTLNACFPAAQVSVPKSYTSITVITLFHFMFVSSSESTVVA